MEIQAIAGFSRLFFVIAVWNHYVFGSIYLIAWWTRFHFPIHTARLQRLCAAAVPFCCCAFVLWRDCTGETTSTPDCCAPPILTWSLVVTSLFSCNMYAIFGSLPFFVFCFKVKKKKKRCTVVGCLQAGSRLSPQLPSESNQCLRRLFWEIYPAFSHVFTVPLPNRSR